MELYTLWLSKGGKVEMPRRDHVALVLDRTSSPVCEVPLSTTSDRHDLLIELHLLDYFEALISASELE